MKLSTPLSALVVLSACFVSNAHADSGAVALTAQAIRSAEILRDSDLHRLEELKLCKSSMDLLSVSFANEAKSTVALFKRAKENDMRNTYLDTIVGLQREDFLEFTGKLKLPSSDAGVSAQETLSQVSSKVGTYFDQIIGLPKVEGGAEVGDQSLSASAQVTLAIHELTALIDSQINETKALISKDESNIKKLQP